MGNSQEGWERGGDILAMNLPWIISNMGSIMSILFLLVGEKKKRKNRERAGGGG